MYAERARITKERGKLLRNRVVQVAELGARFEPSDELGRRADSDVRTDERFLQAFPRELVAGIERGRRELLRKRAPALRERVAQAGKHAAALRFGLRPRVGFAEQLAPGSRHGAER